ncbi:cytochrome P450 [Mycolicibacterium fluoranthenivorans]|uniref:Cytochrome P450 n=1 Tax=Mycolicibacterium fluoranthenivorans TaxID=258505 RepID=A0A1G4WRR9_9MYCO|nr:cytochrome P450 [Mycolicibacterium fluoranthenivorans]SCX28084.1 Cytochrome P450 [Mycolicibacterium fluoranthenivorans]
MKIIPHWREGTLVDYLATELPGSDDVVVARLPFLRYVVVRDPVIARHVLITNQDNYMKSADYDMAAVFFGRALGTELDYQRWQRNRHLMQRVFTKRNMSQFDTLITDAVDDAVLRIRHLCSGGEPVDIGAEMNRLTLDVIARTMFGTDLSGAMSEVTLDRMLRMFGTGFVLDVFRRRLRALSMLLVRITPAAWEDWCRRLPLRLYRGAMVVIAPGALRDLRHIDRVIYQLIADHRQEVITRKDNLLALLMEARDPDTGRRFSDVEIHDELEGFIGAGMETTATTLSWAWKLLAEHSEARDQLDGELEAVLGGRTPRADDVDNLPFTRAVVEETLRMYPPVAFLARVAMGDDEIAGFRVRRGTTIAISLHGLHYHHREWACPADFEPSRYLSENLQHSQRLATMPFGGGKKMCIASGFALSELVLLVAGIAQQLQFDRADDAVIRPEISFSCGPNGPIMVHPNFRL